MKLVGSMFSKMIPYTSAWSSRKYSSLKICWPHTILEEAGIQGKVELSCKEH